MADQASSALTVSEREAIVRWRAARLREAGVEARLSATLASAAGVDFHALLSLVDRGCPPRLAARILAPIDFEEDVA